MTARRGRNPDESEFFRKPNAPSLGEQMSGLALFAPSSPDAAAGRDEGEKRADAGREKVPRRTPHEEATVERLRSELIALALGRMAAARPGEVSGVTADDAWRLLLVIDKERRVSPRVLSTVFRHKGWQWTGHLVKSNRPTNHASDLRVWAWHGGNNA